MFKSISLVAILALAACNTSKGETPAKTAKAVEPPPPAASAPSSEDVTHFLESWLPTVARGDDAAAQALSPSAAIEIAGCTDGPVCLDRIGELAGVAQAMALGDAKVEAVGDRARVTLPVEDIIIGTLELELHRGADGMVVDRVRAEWRDGWAETTDEAALAHAKSWLATFRKKKPAADAGLGNAIVHLDPECDDGAPCVGDRLHEIMATRPDLTFAVRQRADLDETDDMSGKLRTLPRVTFVKVTVLGDIYKAGLERAYITIAIAAGRNDALLVKGVDVDSSYYVEDNFNGINSHDH